MAIIRVAIAGVVGALLMSSPVMAQDSLRGGRYPEQDFGSIPLIDQKDPRYQQAYEHLSRAQQLLTEAARQVQSARQFYAVPGFQFPGFIQQIQGLAHGLEPYLVPEKRRLQYETLTPSANYIVPGSPSARSSK